MLSDFELLTQLVALISGAVSPTLVAAAENESTIASAVANSAKRLTRIALPSSLRFLFQQFRLV
jgi:hypothetical protein